MIFFREFLFLLKKILLIIIISFSKIGPNDVIAQNNAFLCNILCLISFWLQLKYKPFIMNDLNLLNFKASLIMNLTIFLGLFMSISQDQSLQIILLIILFLLNTWFILSFFKQFLFLKILSIKKSKSVHIVNSFIDKYWANGTHIIKIYYIFKKIKIDIQSFRSSINKVKEDIECNNYRKSISINNQIPNSFSERDPIKNQHIEQLIQMEKLNNFYEEKPSSSKNDVENNDITNNSHRIIEDLKREIQNLNDELYFQKQENNKLRDIIKKILKEQTHQYLEPKIPQDFIPELKIGNFSKYFKEDDSNKKNEIIRIPFKKNFYKFWFNEPFINITLNMMNIRFLKIIEHSNINTGFKKFNHEILNKSEDIMNIKDIELKSTNGIYYIYKYNLKAL